MQLPRNGNQTRACRTVVAFCDEMDADERRALLVEQVASGAVLVLPGHVMLYLGAVDGAIRVHSALSSGFDGVIIWTCLGAESPKGSLLSRLTSALIRNKPP